MGGYSIDLIIDMTVAGRFHENGFSCFIAAELTCLIVNGTRTILRYQDIAKPLRDRDSY